MIFRKGFFNVDRTSIPGIANRRLPSFRAQRDLQTLETEYARLKRAGRLHALHWLILAISFSMTFIAWQGTRSAEESRAAARFDREADQLVEQFRDKLQRYADVIGSNVASVVSKRGTMTREQWQRYATSLDMLNQFPATSGIGLVFHVLPEHLPRFLAAQREDRPEFALRPQHDQPIHLPLTFISPEHLEAQAPGLDLAYDNNQRQTILRSAYLDEMQISGPAQLRGSTDPGFIMAAPFYQDGIKPQWQSRRNDFAGAVVASVVARDFADGVLTQGPAIHDARLVTITFADNGSTLFDEHSLDLPTVDPLPLYTRSLAVPMYGRVWDFDIRSNRAFREAVKSQSSNAVLAAGLGIDALLVLLFFTMARAKRKTLEFADYATLKVREKAEALEASNTELQTFAYVVSHDLKTPLRGIQQLASYVEEDLEVRPVSDETLTESEHNLRRIHQQVHRAQALIEGVMAYSRIGDQDETISCIDTRSLLQTICETQSIKPGRLSLKGNFPTLTTYAVRLDQVLSNLISNAYKYHESAESAQVTVAVEREGNFYRFSVSDNGPGIEARHHERIFDVFSTLHSRDDIDSTGVGLSIVKKSVELVGGSIQVHSVMGEGSCFSFTWPASIDRQRGTAVLPDLPRAA